MNSYPEHISLTIPEYQRLELGTQTAMSARLKWEESSYADYHTSKVFRQEMTTKELFRKTYEDIQMLKNANDVSFYPNEYDWMLKQMNNYMPRNETEDTLKRFSFCELADKTSNTQGNNDGTPTNQVLDMLDIDNLLQWKQFQDRKHERFMQQEQVLQDRERETFFLMNNLKKKTLSYTEHLMPAGKPKFDAKLRPFKTVAKVKGKRAVKNRERKPNCWHFMRGHCKRGKYCDFNHDRKNTYPDSFKVFLGGLPFHISEDSLKQQLLEQGFNVINKPKVYGGFCPQVCFATAEEAKRLITGGSIKIGGSNVDVRSYKAFTRKNQEKLEEVSKRSVFLGGLRKGTTTIMIKKKLESLGFKVLNYPLVKEGFSPQVTMETAEQAQRLVKMSKVQMNGTSVDIRPYTWVGAKDRFMNK